MIQNPTLIVSLTVAVAIPVLLLIIRSHVRQNRAALVEEISKAFQVKDQSNPSFEFVKAKYIEGEKRMLSASLLLSAAPFMGLTWVGLGVIFSSLAGNFATNVPWLQGSVFFLNADAKPEDARALYSVLSCVFAGGILFSLQFLMRAVMNFELNPISFLRVTLHMLLAAVTVVVLWRTLPALPVGILESASPWLVVAFLFGFFPDLGLRYLISRVSLPLKSTRDDLLPKIASVPVEVVDGIDSAIRFRLEESNLFDVQNLATANPIMLYVETPFGLYECIDWVAQAQLCTVVGADAFIELRQLNIRSIFDLERATLRDGATSGIRSAVGKVVFARRPAPGARGGEVEAPTQGAAPPVAPAAAPQEAGPAAAAPPANEPPPCAPFNDDDLKHMFESMLDDLHVQRLRQIWEQIGAALGVGYRRLGPLTP